MALYRFDKTMLMLRASSSVRPSSSTPSLFSLVPSFNLSSTLSTPRFTAPFNWALLHHQAALCEPHHSSHHFQSFCFKRLLPLLGSRQSCPRGVTTGSYCTGIGDGESGTGSCAGKERLVQHLVVKEDDHKLLLELQKRILEGEDLSDLAVQYSLCPSKEEGGMLGWVRKGQMVPEFEEAAFNAQLNEVVKCKTKFGWHLLQVLSEREESILEDIQPMELHGRMQDPSFFEEAQLIDVREPEEVAKASIPGFKVLPLRQFGYWGPQVSKIFDPQKDIYVLCHHGMRSLQVAKWLQTQGFRKVFNVSGGIHDYAVKADRSVPLY